MINYRSDHASTGINGFVCRPDLEEKTALGWCFGTRRMRVDYKISWSRPKSREALACSPLESATS